MNYLSVNAMEHFLNSFDKTDHKELRCFCIVLLLYESGARVTELCNVRRYDLHLEKPYTMVTLIDRILRSSKHEEQAYNSCAGVLHSCKDVPHRLVREAAEKCVEANACKYSYFKKVLGMVQNNHSSSGINGKLPSHTNIRGKEAYK